MSKHTPGPWEAERSCDMTGAPLRAWWISAKGDIDIAETSGEKWPEEEAANARLIAAAPELYEALKEALPVLLGLVTDEGLKPEKKGYVCGGYSAYEAAKKALEKAEGVAK